MPTTKPPLLVTETEELTEALAAASLVWPDETFRSRLLARLAIQGSLHLPDPDEAGLGRHRLAAIERHAGRFDGLFPPGYRERLRDEWPA